MDKVKKPLYKKWWFWLIIVVIIGGAIASGGEDTADSNKDKSKSDSSVETAANNDKKDNKEQNQKDKEKTAKKDTNKKDEPKTPQEKLENIIIDNLGKKNNMDKVRLANIQDLTENDSLYFVVTLNADENLTNKLTRSGILLDSKKILEPISKIENLNKIVLQWQLPLTDQYGNTKDGQVLVINLEREQLDKINWENFNVDNFENVSKTYFEHQAFKN